MSEWNETTIYEIVTLIGGGTPKTSVAAYWDGHIPWLSVVDFNNGKKYVFDTEKKITEEGLENSSTKLLEKGDIIISARGTVGVVAMLGKQMAFNQSCYGVRANENSSNEYVYYLLKDRVSNFLQYSHGGVFDTITRDTFKEIDILLPPPEEQSSIAEVLSSIDDKIELLHRQNQTLEQMAETLFRQWFVEEADENYAEIELGELITINGGFSYKGKFIGSGESLLLGMGCVSFNERFLDSGARSYSGDFSEKHLITPGEIVIATRQQSDNLPILGYPAMIPNEFVGKKVIVGTNLYRVRNNSTLENWVLFQLLRSTDYRVHIKSNSKGSTVRMITKDAIESFAFALPPKEKLKEYTTIGKPIYEKLNYNQTQIRTLTALRDALLPKLMSGEVRVQEKPKTPAYE